jgi:hypothetical protein
MLEKGERPIRFVENGIPPAVGVGVTAAVSNNFVSG